MKPLTRVAAVLSPAVALAVLLGPEPASPAGAGGTASARADGVLVRMVGSSFPVVPDGRVESSSSSAQALVSSLDRSQAFASAPYQEFVASLPPTLNGLMAGNAPAVPDYPFFVSSDHPTMPKGEREAGPYRLRASSDARTSQAESCLGTSDAQAQALSATSQAEATYDPDGDVLTAVSSATTTPFALAGVLQVGTTTSRATMVSRSGSAPVQESSFHYDLLMVGGTPVTVDAAGVHVGPTVLPANPQEVAKLLAGSGLELVFLPAERTATSVISAGLEIRYRMEQPSPAAVALVLGRSSAGIDTTLALPGTPAVGAPGVGGEVGPVADGVSATPPRPEPVTPAPASESDAGPFGAGGPSSGATPGSAAAAPPVGSEAAQVAVEQASRPSTLGPRPIGDWAGWRFYAVIVFAGLAGVLATRVAAVRGVRASVAAPGREAAGPRLRLVSPPEPRRFPS